MKEQLVSFETAKLAKEKGFQELCSNYYFEDGEFREYKYIGTNGYYGEEFSFEFEDLLENWNNKFLTKKNGDRCLGCSKDRGYFETFSAPTQGLLQKWLREVHNIYVGIAANYYAQAGKITYQVHIIFDNYLSSRQTGCYNTYEQALEGALQEALKLIKDEKIK